MTTLVLATKTPFESRKEFVRFVKSAARLISEYWRSEKKVEAWTLLIGVTLLEFVGTAVGVYYTFWHRNLFDALELKDWGALTDVASLWVVLIVILLIQKTVDMIITNVFLIRWRQWLSERTFARYMEGGSCHLLQLVDDVVDNPDQRIAEDLKKLVDSTNSFVFDFVRNMIRLPTYIGLLWIIAPPLEFSLGGSDYSIAGYIVYAAFIYALISTVSIHMVAKRLVGLEANYQAREADFRYILIRIREFAESILLGGGQKREEGEVSDRYIGIKDAWYKLVRVRINMNIIRVILGQGVFAIPILVAAPLYIAGSITLGVLMQIRTVFAQVEGAFAWFANAYPQLAYWVASVNRVIVLERAIDQTIQIRRNSNIDRSSSETDSLEVQNLDVNLPNGEVLLSGLNLNINAGESVLIAGPSGGGKTTLFRALSGLWPWGEGRIAKPDAQVMFLPQKGYLPQGTLKSCACYPASPDQFDDEEVKRILRLCCLPEFADRIDEIQPWNVVLSGGEQQRLLAARAILTKPDWLFADEASSALDPDTEDKIYQAFGDELPTTTLVSIAHRRSLRKFHKRIITIDHGIVSDLLIADIND